MRTFSQTFLTLSTVANIRGLKSIAVVFCIGACSLTHAASLNFSGQLDIVVEDNGAAVYSGFPIGTDFAGSIDDVTFDGFVSDAVGTTVTEFSCCIAAGGLGVANDQALDAADAALLNSVAGTSFVAGDLIDAINIEGDALTSGGGE